MFRCMNREPLMHVFRGKEEWGIILGVGGEVSVMGMFVYVQICSILCD